MPRAPKAGGHRRRQDRPAWQGSNRRAELPADWPQIRQAVLARDGYRCREMLIDERCPLRANEADHLGDPMDHSLGNLVAKCGRHHRQKTGREGGQAKRGGGPQS